MINLLLRRYLRTSPAARLMAGTSVTFGLVGANAFASGDSYTGFLGLGAMIVNVALAIYFARRANRS
jgi:hypothetical protein